MDKITKMKVGLFFGSFNPVHVGHMVLANYFLEYTDLKEIWFVVSPQNPFKNKQSLLNERDRLELVNLAIGDNSKMKSCDIEFALPQPSYTINTLIYLKEKFPKKNFALIMGSDNLKNFHKWKNADEILNNFELYVYPRKDYETSAYDGNPKVKMVPAPEMNISSTDIRKGIKAKKDLRYFVPEKAWNYIEEMHFYKK